MYCKYLNNIQCEGPTVRFRIIKMIAYMLQWKQWLKKSKYIEIQYNTDNIQILCIKNAYYINVT